MNVDKKFLVAVFAAAAAITFVLSSRSKDSAQASLDAKKRKRKNALKVAMKIQIQNMINTQKVFLTHIFRHTYHFMLLCLCLDGEKR